MYEQFSKGKEKYLKLQRAWHKSCSLFLLPKDIDTSTVLPSFNEEDADIRKMWQDFCDFHSTTPTTCNNIMIHLSSIVYHVMLEHVHTFTSPQPQSHHFDTASTDDDDVYYRFGGAALCSMLKTRYKHIRKCAEEKIVTISQEITILQSMATKDKLFYHPTSSIETMVSCTHLVLHLYNFSERLTCVCRKLLILMALKHIRMTWSK